MDKITNFQIGRLLLNSETPLNWSAIENITANHSLLPETTSFEYSGKMEFAILGKSDFTTLKSLANELHRVFSISIVCELIEI